MSQWFKFTCVNSDTNHIVIVCVRICVLLTSLATDKAKSARTFLGKKGGDPAGSESTANVTNSSAEPLLVSATKTSTATAAAQMTDVGAPAQPLQSPAAASESVLAAEAASPMGSFLPRSASPFSGVRMLQCLTHPTFLIVFMASSNDYHVISQ